SRSLYAREPPGDRRPDGAVPVYRRNPMSNVAPRPITLSARKRAERVRAQRAGKVGRDAGKMVPRRHTSPSRRFAAGRAFSPLRAERGGDRAVVAAGALRGEAGASRIARAGDGGGQALLRRA